MTWSSIPPITSKYDSAVEPATAGSSDAVVEDKRRVTRLWPGSAMATRGVRDNESLTSGCPGDQGDRESAPCPRLAIWRTASQAYARVLAPTQRWLNCESASPLISQQAGINEGLSMSPFVSTYSSVT